METLHEAALKLTGLDMTQLGFVRPLGLDDRVPGRPSFSLVKESAVFTLHWGFQYADDGSPKSLRQPLVTGQRFGLVSRTADDDILVLNGVRLIFYSEALHPSCKVIEVITPSGSFRTDDNREAMRYLIRTQPDDWKPFIQQSVLVDAALLMSENAEDRVNGVHRRFEKVTGRTVSGKVIDMDKEADPENEVFVVFEDDDISADKEKVSLPPWSEDGIFSASDEVLNPPTSADRPLRVQIKAGKPRGSRSIGGRDLQKLKHHVKYWLTTIQHRGNDLHTATLTKEKNVELVLSLRVHRSAGASPEKRWTVLEDWFSALFNQVENGTVVRSDGTRALEPMDIFLDKVRCAYP